MLQPAVISESFYYTTTTFSRNHYLQLLFYDMESSFTGSNLHLMLILFDYTP